MRKRIIIPLTFLFVLMQALPVWAVNLSINGKNYQPIMPPQLEQGTTMVTLEMIGRVLGADVSVSGPTITIKKGANTLVMTVGSMAATFNGSSITLPSQPVVKDGSVMVPMRFVYEKFGAVVSWQGESQTITVNYAEKRQDMSAEEVLAKSSEAMNKLNTYKMKVLIGMDMQMSESNSGKTENMQMTSKMDMAVQQKPILFYGKTKMRMIVPGTEGLEDIETEILMNENGMYMTMPEKGWVKLNNNGLDMKALLQQSGSEDPLNSIQEMKKYGVIMSFADDQQKNGKNYWVVKVTMGSESFNSLLADTMKKLPMANGDANAPDESAAMGEMMNKMFKNMKIDLVYDVLIDQSNYQMTYMDLEALIKFNMPVPATEDTPASTISMNMNEKATYEIYDLGVSFSVPDVSQAIDFNQYMEGQMQTSKL